MDEDMNEDFLNRLRVWQWQGCSLTHPDLFEHCYLRWIHGVDGFTDFLECWINMTWWTSDHP